MYLEKNQVPAHLRRHYTGNKFHAHAANSVTIPSDAGLWSGGSRTFYSAVELSSGRSMPIPDQHLAPWDDRQSKDVLLKPNFAIVKHVTFQGKDLGLTFYVHPSDIAALIPDNSKADDLSDIERYVLVVCRGIKSSYRADYYQRKGIISGELEAIKAKLIRLGYLNKAGAITVSGKNVAGDGRPY
jgi:hypothetical protein